MLFLIVAVLAQMVMVAAHIDVSDLCCGGVVAWRLWIAIAVSLQLKDGIGSKFLNTYVHR